MPAKKKKSTAAKKAAPKTAAPKKKPVPKKKASSAKKAAPAKKQASPKKKAAPKKKGAPSKRKAAGPKAKTGSEKATPKRKTVGASLKKGKDTPAIFKKVLPKKAGPSNFTLEDVDNLLLKKRKDSTRKSGTAAKGAPKKAATVETGKEIKMEKRNLGAASINDILGIPSGVDYNQADHLNEESKVPKKWLKYYQALVELRDHVNEELQLHASETLKRSSREDSGDLSGYGQHQADAGTDTFDRDLALSMVSSEQDALYEIEQAIKRILNGSYGICEITEKPINKARLAAVPFTRYSVEGQAQWEKMNRRKTDRGGGVFADADDGPTLSSDDDDE